MFSEIFQCQENEVKEYGLKTVNKVRASNVLAGGPEFIATPLPVKGCHVLCGWFYFCG